MLIPRYRILRPGRLLNFWILGGAFIRINTVTARVEHRVAQVQTLNLPVVYSRCNARVIHAYVFVVLSKVAFENVIKIQISYKYK